MQTRCSLSQIMMEPNILGASDTIMLHLFQKDLMVNVNNVFIPWLILQIKFYFVNICLFSFEYVPFDSSNISLSTYLFLDVEFELCQK